MTVPDSLCIDLGASFTKIGYRVAPPAETHLLTHPDLTDEQHFCIPSVAARSPASNRWVFGPHAAGLKAGPRVELHDNWKAELFAPDEGEFSMLDGADPEVRAELVAKVPQLRAFDVVERYLRWLYDVQLPAMLGHDDFKAAQAQLCVPDFVLDSPLASRLDGLMRDIGFVNDGVYTMSEPKANLIGVLSEGRNPLTASGEPNLGAMFGDLSVLRTLSTPGQGVLIVDVGAFTTDIALAGFVHDGRQFDQDPAMSARLGVRKLDEWILADASDEDAARARSNVLEREHFHRQVFGGPTGARQPQTFGLTVDRVDAAVDRFATAILTEMDTFLERSEAHTSFNGVLTGGGANIRGLAKRLAKGLADRGVGALHAPTTTDAPANVQRYGLGPELVRGASAMGGCSILYRL
ncbi:MAG: hypothetical protein AAGA48_20950 [Myxococcota bacterium]